MEIEKLSKENKKLIDNRLYFIIDDYYCYEYFNKLLHKLSDNERFRILLQLESMVQIKEVNNICSK